jgi:hypothetical protein
MFTPNQLVIRTIGANTRFVRRIVSKENDTYMVSDPLFACWGSTFQRWSKPKPCTKKYMERMFSPITDPKMIDAYNNIKKGEKTKTLFV